MNRLNPQTFDLEERLKLHYREERAGMNQGECAQSAAVKLNLARLMAKESAAKRPAAAQPISHARFVADQVKFMHPAIWAGQLALLALALAACLSDALTTSRLLLVASMLGAATASTGLPSFASSKVNGIAELEYACRFNCAHVTIARLIIIGCANAVVLACCCIALPTLAHAGVADVVTRICAPYFITCAGALLITRSTRSDAALTLSALWAFAVIIASYAVILIAPQLYATTSTEIWAAASAAAVVWTACEIQLIIRAAAHGLDVLCPMPSRSL